MFGGRVQFTRDNKTAAMADEVFAQMSDIIKPHKIESPVVDKFATLPLISVEQAMKELLEIENETNKAKP